MFEWIVTTPIDTFAHPETGSKIDLVSMVHIGQPSYYRKLGRYIMARQDEGCTVHYEEIATSDETVEPTSPLERIKRKIQEVLTDESAKSYAFVMLNSGYTVQENSALFRDTGSENHDITEADVVRQTSLMTSLTGLRHARKLRRRLEKAANKGSYGIDEAVFGVIKECVDTATSGKARNKRQDKVTIHVRNQIALEGVDTALAENPASRLVLIWGIGHLAGLQSGLFERGYEHTSRQEIEVAVSRAQLERNIKKHEVSLRRQKVQGADSE